MIPPLERIFNLMGADVTSWYREMAKSKRVHRIANGKGGRAAMLEQHFKSNRCVACDGPHGEDGSSSPFRSRSALSSLASAGLCPDCRAHPTEAIYSLSSRKQALLQRQRALHQICISCSNNPLLEAIACDSIDCPNLYSRVRNTNELAKLADASRLVF